MWSSGPLWQATSITPFFSPSGSGERWPRECLLSAILVLGRASWEPLIGLLTEELPSTASIPDRPGYE